MSLVQKAQEKKFKYSLLIALIIVFFAPLPWMSCFDGCSALPLPFLVPFLSWIGAFKFPLLQLSLAIGYFLTFAVSCYTLLSIKLEKGKSFLFYFGIISVILISSFFTYGIIENQAKDRLEKIQESHDFRTEYTQSVEFGKLKDVIVKDLGNPLSVYENVILIDEDDFDCLKKYDEQGPTISRLEIFCEARPQGRPVYDEKPDMLNLDISNIQNMEELTVYMEKNQMLVAPLCFVYSSELFCFNENDKLFVVIVGFYGTAEDSESELLNHLRGKGHEFRIDTTLLNSD